MFIIAWIDGINAAWGMVQGGNIFGAVVLSYTNVMGYFFYASVMLLAMIMIYLRTNNFGTVTITGILISWAAIPFMPTQSLYFIAIMIVLGITFILYKAFHK